jgi:glycosyltransferase involved in cell wall biosynthesis
MPVFQPDESYLRQAIESVRMQTMEHWELLIIEDPPASRSRDIAMSYGDDRIRHHLRTERTSLADALNEGLQLCRAPLVARFDADDICGAGRLQRQAAYLEANPQLIAVGSSLTIIDSDARVIGHRRLPASAADVARTMRRYNCVAHPAVTFRRDAVLAAGGYPSGWIPEDYDLWCRLIANGQRIENLTDEMVRYRYHPAALKFSAVHDVIRRTIETKERYFARQFTFGDRLRIRAERLLLLLPPRFVLWLFRRLTY